jgi:hypothetical protein
MGHKSNNEILSAFSKKANRVFQHDSHFSQNEEFNIKNADI